MARIALTQNKTAIIDDEDLGKVSQFKWTFAPSGSGYASRNAYLGGGRSNPQRKTVLLHRFIMDAPDGISVDHINHDTPEDAALAYNSAALEHFGQYANLNKVRT